MRKREARHLREVGSELVEDRARVKVREEADTPANNGLVSLRAVRKADARFEYDALDSWKNLVGTGCHHLVVRDGCIVAEIGERRAGASNAVRRAGSAGVAVGAQGQGEFQSGVHAEFVLEVKTEAVEGQRLSGADSEVLGDAAGHAIGELQHAGTDGRIAALARRVVADIVTAEVAAEFEGV